MDKQTSLCAQAWSSLTEARRTVGPDGEIKSSPNYYKNCTQTITTAVFTEFLFYVGNIWVSFAGKLVTKNFQKTPNLVTLDVRNVKSNLK